MKLYVTLPKSHTGKKWQNKGTYTGLTWSSALGHRDSFKIIFHSAESTFFIIKFSYLINFYVY